MAGYFEALDTIGESYKDIEITEGNIKNLHNILMKYCDNDARHKGDYKQVSIAVWFKIITFIKRQLGKLYIR